MRGNQGGKQQQTKKSKVESYIPPVDKPMANEKKEFDITKMPLTLKCKNETQKQFIKMIDENTITLCKGSPGTGKTFLACAQALKLLKSDRGFNKIYLVKSVTTLEGEELGFLKGGIDEKMYPTIISFLDNFHKLIGEDNTKLLMDLKIIEVLPLAFIRGRSIDNAIIIVDEFQNIGMTNMRTAMTRVGDNSKMVFVGDSKQTDIRKNLSCIDTVYSLFENQSDFGTIEFDESHIVRNPIIMRIEKIFDDYEIEQIDKKQQKK